MSNEEFERKKTMKFRKREGADPGDVTFEEEPLEEKPLEEKPLEEETPGEASTDESFELNKTGVFQRIDRRRSDSE